MGAVLGVEVLQIGQVLEVVGVHGAVLHHGVGHNVVIVDLNVQGDVLGGQDLLGDLQDLGVGRGGSGHGDGLALQSVVVHGGVIAVGGVLHNGDNGAGILLGDEVSHLLALQSGLQRHHLRGLVALLHRQNVGVSGGAALDQQGVVHGVQAGVDGVVAVDHGVVHVGQQVGQLGGLSLHDLYVVRILHDVVLGGGDAHAVLQLDDAVLLQQQQGAGLVGGVVGNTDLDDGSVGLVAAIVVGLAAAGSQAQSQHSGQRQSDDLSQSVVFHVRSLL